MASCIKHLLFLFPFVYLISLTFSKSSNADEQDKFWILIDNVNLMECEGPPNQFRLSKDHISVRDKNGQPVRYIESPGYYAIAIDNIKVERSLPNLISDLSISLQVPFIRSELINFDLPHDLVPQKKLLFDGFTCDNESGVVLNSIDGLYYCRYCELCNTISRVETDLSTPKRETNKSILVNLGQGKETRFDQVCQSIDRQTYSIWRTVELPNKKDLTKRVDEKSNGKVDASALQRLKAGRGKMLVRLSVFSNPEATMSMEKFYSTKSGCECCARNSKKACFLNLLDAEELLGGKTSRCQTCSSLYSQSCLSTSYTRVACYVIEFNFRVTDKQPDIDVFLTTGKAWKVENEANEPLASKPANQTNKLDQCTVNQACLNTMTVQAKRFCKAYMQSKAGPAKRFCCDQCKSRKT